MEQNCPVWHSSISIAQSRSLARAQRVAMAAVTGRWAESHSQQLVDLGLEDLELRRAAICRTFADQVGAFVSEVHYQYGEDDRWVLS